MGLELGLFAAPPGVLAPDLFKCDDGEVGGRDFEKSPGFVPRTAKQIVQDHGLGTPLPSSTTSSQLECEEWVPADISPLQGTFNADRVCCTFREIQQEQFLIFQQKARQAEKATKPVLPPQGVTVQTMEIDAPEAPVPIDRTDAVTSPIA